MNNTINHTRKQIYTSHSETKITIPNHTNRNEKNMPDQIPNPLKTRSQITTEHRNQTLQTIIGQAKQNQTWTTKQLVSWITHAFSIKPATAYKWIAQARRALDSEGSV